MANTIKHKRGSGSNPTASDLEVGELAIRTDTGVVFTKKDDNSVAEVAGGVANNSDQSESIGLGPNALDSETSGTENTALGSSAGTAVTTGGSNVFLGRAAGLGLTTGNSNVIIGHDAAEDMTSQSSCVILGRQAGQNTTADSQILIGLNAGRKQSGHAGNIIIGHEALSQQTGTAERITCIGFESQKSNNGGDDNTSVGYHTILNNTTGSGNSAFGSYALRSNTTGTYNVATGYYALYDNTTGEKNVAIGNLALQNNTTGQLNVAIGSEALNNATETYWNIGIGDRALLDCSSGWLNIGIGLKAAENLTSGQRNIVLGESAAPDLTTGDNNICIGKESGDSLTTGDNNIILGLESQPSSATVSNEITLGNSSINSLRIPGLQSGATDGQVLTYSSSNGNITLADASSGSADKITEGNTEAEVVDTGSDGHFKVTTEGTERLRVDSSGRVGIGTDSPEEILHIAAASETVGSRDGVLLQSTSSAAADTGLPIVFTADVGGGFTNYGLASIAGRKETGTVNGSDAAGYLQFATSSTGGSVSEAMRIDSSGHVGIGTTPNDVDSIGRALNIASSTGGAIYLQDTDSLTGKFAAISYNGSTARLQIHAHHSSSFIDLGTNGTERMRIDSSGNVGIGTSSPDSNLVVKGSSGDVEFKLLTHNGISQSRILFADNTAVDGVITYDHNDRKLLIGAGTSTPTDGDLTIDSSGRIGVGTSSPSVELSIAGSDPQLCIWEGSDGDSSSKVQLGTGTTQGFINIQKGDGTRTVQINSDGDSFFNGGDIGIGTDNPTDNLHVYDSGFAGVVIQSGRSSGTIGGLILQDSSGNNKANVYGEVGGELVLGTDGNERMRIDSSGHVSIGTTTATTGRNITMAADTDAGIQITGADAGTNAYITATPGSNAATYIGNTNSRNLHFTVGGNTATKMCIESSGNVGIGTTSPSEKLDVNGSILAERIRLTGAIYENDQNISADYSITSGSNAMSAGPITIDSGVTVTVTSGCTWTVV
jgi:hypothetical protein